MFPCAKVDVAEDQHNHESWSTARTVVEAYIRLRQDYAVLRNIWLADTDVVRLLDARYDFRGAAKIKLTVKGINKYFMSIGTLRLGKNFCNHPELNLLGHYRVWRNVKLGAANPEHHAFYYMCSEDQMTKVPVLDEETAKAKNPFDLDKLLLYSDLCCNSLLGATIMKRCTNDEISSHLTALRNPKQPCSTSKKRAAPELRENETEESAAKAPRSATKDSLAKNSAAAEDNDRTEKKVRRKPGPKPKPKPPPPAKLCVGWSGPKVNPLIRRSLVQCLDAQPSESNTIIPSTFPLVGPRDFHVVYNRHQASSSSDAEALPSPQFVVYANGHDPSNCERAQRSYKHCLVCTKASGRLRTYLYLKKSKNHPQQHDNAAEEDDDGGDCDNYDEEERTNRNAGQNAD